MNATTWWRLDGDGARRHASVMAGRAMGARLVDVRLHLFAGSDRWVATVDVGGELFAIVPGGEVTAGYNVARFAPTAEQLGSYPGSVAEFGMPDDIYALIG